MLNSRCFGWVGSGRRHVRGSISAVVQVYVRRFVVIALALSFGAFAVAAARVRASRESKPPVPTSTTREIVLPAAPLPKLQDKPAEQERLEPEQRSNRSLGPEGARLAAELGTMWTRDPEHLVEVLQDAAARHGEIPLPLLLAIAHTETNGRVLLISEAGAVGLAQATPIAYLMEQRKGKLFVTDDYLTGSRAYYLKKPLHDAEMIASLLIDEPQHTLLAQQLLNAAYKYRGEGIRELESLTPYASGTYLDSVAKMDADNLAALEQLDGMIAGNASKTELTSFRDDVRSRYRSLRQLQAIAWKSYQKELTEERDRLLRKRYKVDPALVIRNRAYEAGEYLAENLDDRFSPLSMADFLADHLATKRLEAEEIGTAERDLERMTAGLYNGGGHNIKRMISGLITSLPETDNYMRKVPATRARLEQAIAEVAPQSTVASR